MQRAQEIPEPDKRLEDLIAWILRGGVMLAACIVLAGGAVYLLRHARPADYRVFQAEPASLRAIPGIFHEAMHLEGRGIIQLGLLVLIATPIVRVAFSALVFCYERDWKYVGFTLVVLALLLFSLLARR